MVQRIKVEAYVEVPDNVDVSNKEVLAEFIQQCLVRHLFANFQHARARVGVYDRKTGLGTLIGDKELSSKKY